MSPIPIFNFFMWGLAIIFSTVDCTVDCEVEQTFVHGVGDELNIGPAHSLSLNSKPDNCILDEDSQEHEEDKDSGHLVEVDHRHNFFSLLYDGIYSGVSTVYSSASTAGDHLYTKVYDVSSIFAEKVRKILKEELFDLVAESFAEVIQTITAPGNMKQ